MRYQYYRDVETNTGVGQFNLPETGTNVFSQEHTLQATDTQVIGAHAINESRFQFIHDDSENTPVSTLTNLERGRCVHGLRVRRIRHFGPAKAIRIPEHHVPEFPQAFLEVWRKDSSAVPDDRDQTSGNFNGTFSFGSRQGAFSTCPNSLVNGSSATSRRFRPTRSRWRDLPKGLPFSTIQAEGGGVSIITPRRFRPPGAPKVIPSTVTLVDAGLFVQDDWKVRPNVTLSYGLRFETQNNFSDKSDFAPRVGLAWGIGGDAKKPPKIVLRAGFGIFYDRFTYDLVETQQRYNVLNPMQQQLQIQNPAFFLPLPSTLPTGTLVSTDYANNPNLRTPYTIQTGVTVERQLTKAANLAVTYLNSRGVHQFYTNNLNPFIPANDASGGVRPNPSEGNIFQYQSAADFEQNQLIVNGRLQMGAKLSLFGYYTYNRANSDTAGVNSFPSNPLDFEGKITAGRVLISATGFLLAARLDCRAVIA